MMEKSLGIKTAYWIRPPSCLLYLLVSRSIRAGQAYAAIGKS
jgi:hypothetical protein